MIIRVLHAQLEPIISQPVRAVREQPIAGRGKVGRDRGGGVVDQRVDALVAERVFEGYVQVGFGVGGAPGHAGAEGGGAGAEGCGEGGEGARVEGAGGGREGG